MASYKLLVRNAEQLVQVVRNGEIKVSGKAAMNNIAILNRNKEAGGLSVVVNQAGRISDVGYDAEINRKYQQAVFEKVIDAEGICIIPGLVDAHSHPVWSGDRVHEFALKLSGASYMEIHASGGGIHYTVEKTREASQEQLLTDLLDRLGRMLRSGTTLLEAKSGYGLDAENEVKMLRVLEKAKELSHITISSTFCGAHAVPKGSDSESATQQVLDVMLPRVAALNQSGELKVDSVDVFCEKGVFDLGQTERILASGRQLGFMINFHADELHPMAAAEMGARLGAEAMSHLEEISQEGIQAMAGSGSVAVLLPTTAFVLRLTCPPARKMIEAGVPIALGSDFNPNAFCLSMPMVMNLACVMMKMSLEESLVAATINAAASIRKSSDYGSLEVGKMADMLLLRAPRWEHLVYQLGGHDHVIKYVIKAGEVVHENQD